MKSLRQKPLLWYLAVQLITLICFYFPWLCGASSFYFRDVPHYVEPFCRFVADTYQHFRLPLWNPWCYCGMPQAAVSVQGIFYPPTWLFVFLPFNSALACSMIFHQVLCGLGGFLMASSFGWGMLSAVLCAITLSMSGYMFSLVPNFTLVCTAAWCPLSLWAIGNIGRPAAESTSGDGGGNRHYVYSTAIAAGCVSMLVLAGHPELATFNLALIAGYSIKNAHSGWRAKTEDWTAILEWRVKAVGLGLLIAMPAILPAYEWLGLSRRSSGLLAAETLLLSANWYDLLNLILPQPLGDLQLRYAQFRPLVMTGQIVPYVPAAFVGPVIATLALWGMADKTFKLRWLVLALMLLAIALALGANAPLAPALVTALPNVSIIRFPVKLLFFVVWCLAIFAARGLYLLSGGLASSRLPVIFWSVFILGAALIQIGINWADPLLHTTDMTVKLQQLWHQGRILIAQSAIAAGLVGISVALSGLYVSRHRQHGPLVSSLITLLAVGTLLYHAISFCHRGAPPNFFQQPSFVDTQLKHLRAGKATQNHDRILALYLERFTVPPAYDSKDPDLATVNMYQYSRQLLRPNTNIDFREPSSFGFEGTSTGDYYYFLLNSYLKSTQAFGQTAEKASDDTLGRFCQLTATRYVLTQCYRFGNEANMVPIPLLDSRMFNLVSVSNDMNARIYELRDTLPRAYFSNNWLWSNSRDLTMEGMFDPARTRFDPLKTTVLETPTSNAADDLPAPQKGQLRSPQSGVTIVEENEQAVSLSVQAPQAGFVVLADQYYPGWCAELDGKPAEIFIANAFTRAVKVTAGKHLVNFYYRPQSVWIGLLLALVAIVWLSCLIFMCRHDRRVSAEKQKLENGPSKR